MPGNQGGANWGTTAANPEKGLVFVVGVNQVAILKLEDVRNRTLPEGRGGGGGGQGGAPLQAGFLAYQQVLHRVSRGEPARGAAGRDRSGRHHRPHRRGRDQGGDHRRQGQHAAGVEHHRRRDGFGHFLPGAVECIGWPWGPRRRTWRRAAGRVAARSGRRERRGATAAATTALHGPVLSRNRRQCRQPAVSRGREGRAAGNPLHDRLRRARVVHQAAVHDADRLRPQHRRDQMAGPQRRPPADDGRGRPVEHGWCRRAVRHRRDQRRTGLSRRRRREGAGLRRGHRAGAVDRHLQGQHQRRAGELRGKGPAVLRHDLERRRRPGRRARRSRAARRDRPVGAIAFALPRKDSNSNDDRTRAGARR